MNKVCMFCVCIALLLCLASCSLADGNPGAEATAQATGREETQSDVSYIEVQYFSFSEKYWESVKIEDEETVAALTAFIVQADGERKDYDEILFGYPSYLLDVYYANGEQLYFSLLNEEGYMLKQDLDIVDRTTIYYDDMSEMYAYLCERFPDIYAEE